jgi:hypothetical protein
MAAALLCLWSVTSAGCSCFAKLAKKPADKARWTRENELFSLAFSPCTSVEVKSSLRTRLARQTHAQPVEKSIASLVLRLF